MQADKVIVSEVFGVTPSTTFILMGINNVTGMVQILEGGIPNEVHHTDIVGLQYLGLTCPVGGGGPGGNCFQQFIPGVGWVWICR
ncbi:hypothetical protein Q8G35_07090 [Peribacillus simplex]|uniref:Uncharacterized protein n=2 Tax=Peribacillus TaxID=2675229 RepID=A0AA90T5Z1_9BACI|nr:MULTISPECIES: hypothetical protein [Peribacillus]MDP1418171.1 hypothetical protein [Peribacillus simplex]MDP1451047.1 hypothetical protein [Peribacillus frigoritolerans]